MNGHKVYKNPPIKEVVCSINISTDDLIDTDFLAEFEKRIKNNYPEYKKANRISDECKKCKELPDIEDAVTHRFINKEKKSCVIIDDKTIELHMIGEYESGEDFIDEIISVYSIYSELVHISGITTCGLGYFNKITLDTLNPDLDDYFTISPKITGTVINFNIGFETENKEDKYRTRVIFRPTISKDKEKTAFVLEVMSYTIPDVKYSANPEIFKQWLIKAHENIDKTFEMSITPKTREIFGEKND